MAKSKTKAVSKRASKGSPKGSETVKSRRLKQPSYKSFRLGKRIKHPKSQLPTSFSMFRQAIRLIRSNWKLFGGITLIYAFLTLILVRGFTASGFSLAELKILLQNGFSSGADVISNASLFVSYLLDAASSTSTPAGSVYQTILVIIVSLATIWAFRELLAGKRVRTKDTFYKSLYPLVPFILVLLVIGLQLLPLAIGSWLYNATVGGGVAVAFVEKFLWTLIFFLLGLLSLYMFASSVFALYIVTLPGMTPLKALRSARQLVIHRRFTVLRKIIFLPVILLILEAIILIPLILLLTPMAEGVFFVMSMFVVVVIHAYMYTLYRELL